MPYIKPNGEDIKYEVTVSSTITQGGIKAILFVGEDVPNTYTDGFKYYKDNGSLISDLSQYKYNFKQNVYSVEEDTEYIPKPNNTPSVGGYGDGGVLTGLVEKLRQQVAEMETYSETKTVYIRDTECVFDMPKKGIVSAILEVNGVQIPCNYEVCQNQVHVTFEPLEEVGTVTLFIAQ